MCSQPASNSERRAVRSVIAAVATVITVVTLIACTSDTDSPITPPPPPDPTIDIQLASGAFSVMQGQSVTIVVNVSRGGGYKGAILLDVADEPLGVTTSLDATVVPYGVASSTLTVAAAATMEPGTYTLSITGSGVGVVSQSVSLVLTVTSAGPPAISVKFILNGEFVFTVQGDRWTWPGVTVTRHGGYTGVVNLTIEGLPPNVTASFDPGSLGASTTTSAVTFTATTTAAPGETYLTIRAKGAGVPDATTVFRFIVFPPARRW